MKNKYECYNVRFENGRELQFNTLGQALDYAHKNNTRILRYW